MKILHVFDHSIPLHDGYSFRSRAILLGQRKRGWETAHVTSEKQGDTDTSKETVDGLTFYRTPVSRNALSKLPVFNQLQVVRSLSARLEEAVIAERPDVLHAHSPLLNGLAALKVGKKHGIPVVYETRAFWEDAAVDNGSNKEGDLRYKLTRAMESHVFNKADAITTICEGLRRDIVARGNPDSKVTVIPNAVDIDQFDIIAERNQELADKLGLNAEFTLGFVGSFYDYEGLDLLLDAVAELVKQGKNVQCLMVGGGPEDANLKAQAKRLGIESNVLFTGRVPHSEVSAYYSLIDLLVYARKSLRITELVTPLKPLEAMAQGRLFVASNVGGHHELIEHGKTGLLFEKDSVTSLVDVINQYQQGEWPSNSLIEQGREFVTNVRSWKNSVARYEKIYQSLIAK